MIIGADSHTCTYGALGAFSTGVGSTDMAAGMATGKAWFKVPSAIRINLIGKPSKWVSGKDVILHIIGEIGVDGALYQSMEFTGEGVANLTMDDRFTIANMAIEAGGKNGIFPVDDKAIAYMENIPNARTGFLRRIRMRCMRERLRWISVSFVRPSRFRISRKTQRRSTRLRRKSRWIKR